MKTKDEKLKEIEKEIIELIKENGKSLTAEEIHQQAENIYDILDKLGML